MPPVTDQTLLRYCQTLYDVLEKDAKKVDGYDLVWEGKLIAVFGNLGISNSHYSKVMSTMYEIGSIEMIRRGARGVQTLIALHARPSLEHVHKATSHDRGLTPSSESAKLERRVKELERRLEGIDVRLMLGNHEERVRKLEGRK